MGFTLCKSLASFHQIRKIKFPFHRSRRNIPSRDKPVPDPLTDSIRAF